MIPDTDQCGNIAALSEASDDQKTTFFSPEFRLGGLQGQVQQSINKRLMALHDHEAVRFLSLVLR
jgi:hypothetical protein